MRKLFGNPRDFTHWLRDLSYGFIGAFCVFAVQVRLTELY